MKLVINKFKSGGLLEKHVVATWNLGNHLSICLEMQGNQEKPVSRWPVAGPSEYRLLASSLASKVKRTIRTANTHKMTTIHTRQLQQYTQDIYNNTNKTSTTIHTRRLTTIHTRRLTKIHTRQLTITHTRRLTTIHTRQLTTIHTKQLQQYTQDN